MAMEDGPVAGTKVPVLASGVDIAALGDELWAEMHRWGEEGYEGGIITRALQACAKGDESHKAEQQTLLNTATLRQLVLLLILPCPIAMGDGEHMTKSIARSVRNRFLGYGADLVSLLVFAAGFHDKALRVQHLIGLSVSEYQDRQSSAVPVQISNAALVAEVIKADYMTVSVTAGTGKGSLHVGYSRGLRFEGGELVAHDHLSNTVIIADMETTPPPKGSTDHAALPLTQSICQVELSERAHGREVLSAKALLARGISELRGVAVRHVFGGEVDTAFDDEVEAKRDEDGGDHGGGVADAQAAMDAAEAEGAEDDAGGADAGSMAGNAAQAPAAGAKKKAATTSTHVVMIDVDGVMFVGKLGTRSALDLVHLRLPFLGGDPAAARAATSTATSTGVRTAGADAAPATPRDEVSAFAAHPDTQKFVFALGTIGGSVYVCKVELMSRTTARRRLELRGCTVVRPAPEDPRVVEAIAFAPGALFVADKFGVTAYEVSDQIGVGGRVARSRVLLSDRDIIALAWGDGFWERVRMGVVPPPESVAMAGRDGRRALALATDDSWFWPSVPTDAQPGAAAAVAAPSHTHGVLFLSHEHQHGIEKVVVAADLAVTSRALIMGKLAQAGCMNGSPATSRGADPRGLCAVRGCVLFVDDSRRLRAVLSVSPSGFGKVMSLVRDFGCAIGLHDERTAYKQRDLDLQAKLTPRDRLEMLKGLVDELTRWATDAALATHRDVKSVGGEEGFLTPNYFQALRRLTRAWSALLDGEFTGPLQRFELQLEATSLLTTFVEHLFSRVRDKRRTPTEYEVGIIISQLQYLLHMASTGNTGGYPMYNKKREYSNAAMATAAGQGVAFFAAMGPTARQQRKQKEGRTAATTPDQKEAMRMLRILAREQKVTMTTRDAGAAKAPPNSGAWGTGARNSSVSIPQRVLPVAAPAAAEGAAVPEARTGDDGDDRDVELPGAEAPAQLPEAPAAAPDFSRRLIVRVVRVQGAYQAVQETSEDGDVEGGDGAEVEPEAPGEGAGLGGDPANWRDTLPDIAAERDAGHVAGGAMAQRRQRKAKRDAAYDYEGL